MTLSLRPWRVADASALVDAIRSGPELIVQVGGAPVEDEEAARAVIMGRLLFTERVRNWAVTRDGVPVGNVGLSAIERRNDTAWCHYWLAPSVRGQCSASRALASVAVARRAGFIAEGIERQKLRYGTERFDVETHSRLRTDPAPQLDLLAFSHIPG